MKFGRVRYVRAKKFSNDGTEEKFCGLLYVHVSVFSKDGTDMEKITFNFLKTRLLITDTVTHE